MKNQREQVTKVINLINEEGVSLGAIVRNFIAVAESDNFAAYMLRTICKHENPLISLTVNEIKNCVIKAYPYKDENNKLLKKDGGLFVPIESYTGDIIRKAFYNVVSQKDISFEAATAEQIAEHKEKKETAKKAAKAKRETEKKEIESIKAFYERIMNAESKEIAWALILEQKSANK